MISANQQLQKLTINPVTGNDRTYPLRKVALIIAIRIENLDVYIEDQHILKDINLAIPEKSITCIIGPSGCGKTTFLKTLNRMHDESPEVKISGKVFVDGENIYDKRVNVIDTRKKMGLLAQRPCPLPMSIFDNVAYGPRIHGIRRRKKINQTVIQYLQYVGLWDEVRGQGTLHRQTDYQSVSSRDYALHEDLQLNLNIFWVMKLLQLSIRFQQKKLKNFLLS